MRMLIHPMSKWEDDGRVVLKMGDPAIACYSVWSTDESPHTGHLLTWVADFVNVDDAYHFARMKNGD